MPFLDKFLDKSATSPLLGTTCLLHDSVYQWIIMPTDSKGSGCCSPRPKLDERPLLSFVDAVKVMALFKVLANDTRIRLLHHMIRSGESTVTDLGRAIG